MQTKTERLIPTLFFTEINQPLNLRSFIHETSCSYDIEPFATDMPTYMTSSSVKSMFIPFTCKNEIIT